MAWKTAKRYKNGRSRKPQAFRTRTPGKKPKKPKYPKMSGKRWHGETRLDFLRPTLRSTLSKIPIDKRPHVTEIENDDLTLSGLRHKLVAAREGHDEYLAKLVEKDMRKRRTAHKGRFLPSGKIVYRRGNVTAKLTYPEDGPEGGVMVVAKGNMWFTEDAEMSKAQFDKLARRFNKEWEARVGQYRD